jgi:hypothetical protein
MRFRTGPNKTLIFYTFVAKIEKITKSGNGRKTFM